LLKSRRNDCWRNQRNKIDEAGFAGLFAILSARARPPARLIRCLRQALAAAPIEVFERGERRHARGRAVAEFSQESWAGAILMLAGFRLGDAIASRFDDSERVVKNFLIGDAGAVASCFGFAGSGVNTRCVIAPAITTHPDELDFFWRHDVVVSL